MYCFVFRKFSYIKRNLKILYLITFLHIVTYVAEPDAPSSISIQEFTETSITINVQPGKGKVEYFNVRKDGTFYLQIEASNSNTTQVIIEGLTPGTLYNNVFTVFASSNGLNSTSVRIPSQATSKFELKDRDKNKYKKRR